MSMIIGIDPGLKGGIAYLNNKGSLYSVGDIPLIKNKFKEKTYIIDIKKVFNSLNGCHTQKGIHAIIIEDVHAMPKQGVSSMFTFGFGYGMINAAISCSDCGDSNLFRVTPQAWKKHFGLIGKDKNAGLDVIRSIWRMDMSTFITPRGRIIDGRVDATLIAKYYYEKFIGSSQ